MADITTEDVDLPEQGWRVAFERSDTGELFACLHHPDVGDLILTRDPNTTGLALVDVMTDEALLT